MLLKKRKIKDGVEFYRYKGELCFSCEYFNSSTNNFDCNGFYLNNGELLGKICSSIYRYDIDINSSYTYNPKRK